MASPLKIYGLGAGIGNSIEEFLKLLYVEQKRINLKCAIHWDFM